MSRVYTLIIGFVNFFCVLFSIPIIDKLGRRPMMIVGVFGLIIDLILLGLFSEIVDSGIVYPVIFTVLFLVIWALSVGPIL